MLLYETEYFLAIVAAQNMNRAAQNLFISPSALSQFLSRLERRLGTELIVRGKDSLQLTPAGVVFYEAACQIEQIKSSMRGKLGELLSSGSDVIRVGVTGTRGLKYASYLWPLLQAALPQYKFYLSTEHAKQLYEQVLEGTIDFAFSALDLSRQPQFGFLTLHREEIGLLVPEGHPLLDALAAQGISPDDPASIELFRDTDIILNRKNSIITRSCIQYFRREGFFPYRLTYSMQSAAPEVACITSAVTMCSSGMADVVDGMVFQRLKNPPCYTLGVVYRGDRELSEADRTLLELAEREKEHY